MSSGAQSDPTIDYCPSVEKEVESVGRLKLLHSDSDVIHFLNILGWFFVRFLGHPVTTAKVVRKRGRADVTLLLKRASMCALCTLYVEKSQQLKSFSWHRSE